MRNRWFLLLGGVGLVGGTVLFVITGTLAAVYLACMGIVLILAGLLVGPRYRTEIDQPPEGFVFTGERFVDPTSRRTIDVWQHPVSGQRVYVLAPDPPRPERGS